MHLGRAVLSNPSLLIGGLIVLLFVVVAAAAPLIAPAAGKSPYQIPRDGFQITPSPPSPRHHLGTLSGGYDVFHGLIWGTRLAFKLGVSIALGRAVIGVLLGLLAGYAGGLLDRLIMRVTDAFMAVPLIAAALLMLVLLADTQPIILVLILFGWMPCARLIRGNVLVEHSQDYIQAAVSLGTPNRWIIFRHLLPNITRGLFALITLDVGAALIWAATFYFIGLTGSPDGNVQADWGQMLSLARDWIVGPPSEAFKYWYSYLPVSLALVLFSLGWSFIGDGLADALDPRRQASLPPLRI